MEIEFDVMTQKKHFELTSQQERFEILVEQMLFGIQVHLVIFEILAQQDLEVELRVNFDLQIERNEGNNH